MQYLKSKTAYGDIFAPNSGTEITAESIEFNLKKELANRLQKICTFERMIDDRFYDYYILMSDTNAIISAARTLVSTSALASSYLPSAFFTARSALNMDALFNARNATELIEATRHTRYYEVTRKFINADGVFDFSMVEIHMARFYAEQAKKMGKKYLGKSAKELNEIVDLEIDALNIANIYRLKNLKTEKEDIFAKLIFEHGTIGKSKLLALLDAKTDMEFIAIIEKTKLGKHFSTSDLMYPEHIFHENMYKIKKRYLRFSSNPDITVIAYMDLLQCEIDNITHIVEGKRYRLPNDKIAVFLIGTDA